MLFFVIFIIIIALAVRRGRFALPKSRQQIQRAAKPAQNHHDAKQDNHRRNGLAAPNGKGFLREALTRF